MIMGSIYRYFGGICLILWHLYFTSPDRVSSYNHVFSIKPLPEQILASLLNRYDDSWCEVTITDRTINTP